MTRDPPKGEWTDIAPDGRTVYECPFCKRLTHADVSDESEGMALCEHCAKWYGTEGPD